jgi:hypothetical protein
VPQPLRDHHDVATLQENILLQILSLSEIAISKGEYLSLSFNSPDDLDVVFCGKGRQPSG